MKFNLFGYELQFGRPRKTAERNSIQQFFGFFPSGFGRQNTVKKPNANSLRGFAKSAIPRRAISIVKDGVLGLDYRIVPKNPEDKTDYKELIKMVTNIIEKPNDTETYKSFWGALLEDTLIGDCGVAEIVKCGNVQRPIYLFNVDGFTMEFVQDWQGQTDIPRYAQKQGTIKTAYFLDQDIMYVKKNNFTDTPFGLSPLESAFQYVDYLLNAQNYANSVAGKGLPKFILNLGENLNDVQIEAFRKYMEEEVYGTGNIPVIGGTKGVGSHQIGAINDDGLFLEWQSFLMTIIAFSFGVDPKKLGQGSATDRSTVAEQNEGVLNEAIKPYAELLADSINRKILARIGLDEFLKFEFIFEETLEQKKLRTDIVSTHFEKDAITQNEMRSLLGYPPRKSKYADMTISEMKACINKDYQVQGGFNGVGKDRHDGLDSPKGGEKEDDAKE